MKNELNNYILQFIDFIGGQGRNRTTDTRIFSPRKMLFINVDFFLFLHFNYLKTIIFKISYNISVD